MKKSENNKESSSSCPEAIPGCGSNNAGYVTAPINLNITTTTGGNFSVLVDVQNSVENLKKIIAKKLKVAKDRICLLHRERELQDGNLRENGLFDGSKIILIPNVETGLLAQRPENTVLQALESLNDAQVNDFLSGKTPLNLSMRLGDHMMLIQLQLSTVSPSSPPHNNRSRPRSRSGRPSASSSSTSSTFNNVASCIAPPVTCSHDNQYLQGKKTDAALDLQQHNHHQQHNVSQNVSTSVPNSIISRHLNHSSCSSSLSTSINSTMQDGELNSFLSKHGFESLHNIVKNFSTVHQQQNEKPKLLCGGETKPIIVNNCCSTTTTAAAAAAEATANNPSTYNNSGASALPIDHQSPIKSLSNLVSSNPIKPSTTAAKDFEEEDESGPSMCSDPISAKLTSCLCKRLDSNNTNTTIACGKECETNQCQSKHDFLPSPSLSERQLPMEVDPELPEQQLLTATGHSAAAEMTTDNLPTNSFLKPLSTVPQHSSSILHKTVNNPIMKHKHHHHHRPHHSSVWDVLKKNFTTFDQKHCSSSTSSIVTKEDSPSLLSSPSPSLSSSTISKIENISASGRHSSSLANNCNTNSSDAAATTIVMDEVTPRPTITATDARALVEASRNLTQTLRKLSKEVFTNKVDLSDQTPLKSNSGAVIESMKNHGKGIYSGTFSGTLNPALQDQYGRPKRDISTVIHILNDLLSATPQYNRDTRISFEPSSASVSSSSSLSFTSSTRGGSTSKQQSTRYNNFLTPAATEITQECRKCVSNLKPSSNITCAYGECNGHTSAASSSSSSMTTPAAAAAVLNAFNGVTGGAAATNTITSGNTHHHHHPHHHHHHNHNHHHHYMTSTSSNGLSCQDSSPFNHVSGSSETSRLSSELNLSSSATDERNLCTCHNSSSSINYRNHLGEFVSNNMITTVSNNDMIPPATTMMCSKCSIDLENSKTKCKLDQLRLVMQQKKQRREARKLKAAPYEAARDNMLNSSSSSSTSQQQHNNGDSSTSSNGGGNGGGVAASSATVTAAGGQQQQMLAAGNGSTATAAGGNAATATPGGAGAGASAATTSATTAAPSNTITSIAPPSEVSPNHIVEEVDTAA